MFIYYLLTLLLTYLGRVPQYLEHRVQMGATYREGPRQPEDDLVAGKQRTGEGDHPAEPGGRVPRHPYHYHLQDF